MSLRFSASRIPLSVVAASLVAAAPSCYSQSFQLYVKPISICNNDGTACNPVVYDEDAIDKVFAQADIDVVFMSSTTANVSSMQDIASGAELSGILGGPDGFAGKSEDPKVVNLWFVNTVQSGALAGIATLNDRGAAVAASAVSVRGLVAHELAHALGLDHVVTSGNLMTATIPQATLENIAPDGTKQYKLEALQQATIQGSPILTAVPEPAHFSAAVAAFLLGWGVIRRRTVASHRAS